MSERTAINGTPLDVAHDLWLARYGKSVLLQSTRELALASVFFYDIAKLLMAAGLLTAYSYKEHGVLFTLKELEG